MKKLSNKKDFDIIGVAIAGFIFVSGFIFIFPNQAFNTLSFIKKTGVSFASVILSHNFRSIAEIKSHYDFAELNAPPNKVRILIVPGHEPNFGGSEFNKLKERDMNVQLGQYLQKLLESNPHYQVFISRDAQTWSTELASYYKDNWNEIEEWRKASRDEFSLMVLTGSTTRTYSTVGHNAAPENTSLRLYGLTKWSNENKIDIVIHVHFNDNRRSNTNKPGNYSGFSIYVPSSQYGNSATTKAIANTMLNRLEKYNPKSNLPTESNGVIDEPELTAIGSNNTSDAASMLIEYGYMYEPQFQYSPVRDMAIKDLAFQTYLGLQDFFDPSDDNNLSGLSDTSVMPYRWNVPSALSGSKIASPDIFALQTALTFDGVYPPNGKNKNDCPRTGIAGPCTRTSLDIFQNKYGIVGEKGIVGLKTLEVLNMIDR